MPSARSFPLIAGWQQPRRVMDYFAQPDWESVPGVVLLKYVDPYEDSVFNPAALGALAEDVQRWRDFERHEPGSRDVGAELSALIGEAIRERWYVMFLGA